MSNNTTNQPQNQQFSPQEQGELSESATPSGVPKPISRFIMPVFEEEDMPPQSSMASRRSLCEVCGGQIDRDNVFQQSLAVCRKCLRIYVQVEKAIDEKEKQRRLENLERFIGGADANR
jgi:ribosomal protein S14